MDTVNQQNLSRVELSFYHLRLAMVVLLTGVISACAGSQDYSSAQYDSIGLAPTDLESYGLAFISPSTVTGREEDKQALAFIVAKVLKKERPTIRQVSLPHTLGAINNAGLTLEYKAMYENYRSTGIFDQLTLAKIGGALNVRYLLQLNLASFNQGSRGRYSILGYRVFETKHADIRIFFQIWDTETGSIVWEGVEELILAEDTTSEKVINFTSVVKASAGNLIKLFPNGESSPEQVTQIMPAQ